MDVIILTTEDCEERAFRKEGLEQRMLMALIVGDSGV